MRIWYVDVAVSLAVKDAILKDCLRARSVYSGADNWMSLKYLVLNTWGREESNGVIDRAFHLPS